MGRNEYQEEEAARDLFGGKVPYDTVKRYK